MFKKSKSIFIFLLLIFTFGIASSSTSFSSFNLNSPVLSTSSKVKERKRRQPLPSAPTEVEWNNHMAMIRPILQILAGFNKATIIFKIGPQGARIDYSVTNLIKAQNIDAKYSAMSPEAQTELKLLHTNGIDDAKLTTAYKTELDNFFASIKPHLDVLKDIKNTIFDGYYIDELVKNLDKKGSELTSTAKVEFIELWANDLNATYLSAIYKKTLDDPFLKGIKSSLQVLKAMGSTEVTIDGKDTPFQISNLIKVLETVNWETNTDASKELAALYKHNPNHSVVNKELEVAYELLLDTKPDIFIIYHHVELLLNTFLAGIKPALLVLKVMGSSEVIITSKSYSISNLITVLKTGNWKTNKLAREELVDLYKHNPDHSVVKKELQAIYKVKLGPFLIGIKPTLKVFETMGSTEVTIDGKDTPFQISNLIKVLKTVNWETNTDASKELAALYKHNPNHSVVNKELEVAYELLLNTFLAGIKSALQVLKVMGSSEVIITSKSYSISNLITVLKTGNWKTNKLAREELVDLYKHNPDHSVVKKELQAIYKIKLGPFLIGIKPTLKVFETMGSTEVTIGGFIYKIGHLIIVLDKNDWETNIDASKELAALYKHNFDHSVVEKELQAIYKLKLGSFLKSIKPTLKVFETMGSVEITIDRTAYKIGHLITVLDKNDWETNTDASKELAALYKHNSNHSVVNKELEVAYELLLDTFLAGIKSALQVLKTMGSTEVIINGESYSISNLITVLKTGNWKTNKSVRAELINLYKHNSNHSVVNKELEVAYELLLNTFLAGIKPALLVLKVMGSSEVIITSKSYSISNLITVLKTGNWKTNKSARAELINLYKHDPDHSVVKKELQAIYKVKLGPFLIGIKPTLKVFETMGSTEVTIDGKDTPFQISNLIKVLETVNWETNTDASKELAALYKHNSNHSVVNKELEVAYELLLDTFLAGIKPALQVLKVIENTELITSDWKTNKSARLNLINLYKYNPDHSVVKKDLQANYKLKLGFFLKSIKPTLKVFETMGSTEVTIGGFIYKIGHLITVLDKNDWETNTDASKELGFLHKHNSNHSVVNKELEVAYELLLNTFLAGIKPALLVLKVMGSTEVIINDKSYSISNLITILYKNNWKTNKLAGEELVDLYKHNSDHSVVEKELQAVYKLKLGPFLKSIKPALLVLKVMGESSQLLIGVGIFNVGTLNNVLDKNDWETNTDASKELGYLYKHNLDHSVVDFIKIDLQATYKVKLEPFLIGIKSVLQVLKTIGSAEITIDRTAYKIGNLITILDKNDWETNIDAIKELAALYKYNPNHKVVNKHLQVAYKLKLGPFLIGIKSALQVFKIIGSTEVTMDVTIYPIDNLITAFETLYLKTNIPASQELATLYKYNSNHSVVNKELQTAYKLKLEPFLKSIKPTLKVFKTMGSTEVTIDGKDTPFQISNLIKVLETVNWETNTDASKELAALYKHNSNHSVVNKELQTAYKLKLGPFLKSIKPTLKVFETMGSAEITIDRTAYKIGNLITILEIDDWETNIDASKELAALYKHNSNHSVVNKELEVAYELLLDTFLAGIKSALQVLKTVRSTEVIINGKSYSISNLITVLKIGNWKTNKFAREELVNLYKHNLDHSVVNKELEVAYELLLNTFLAGIKPALQALKTMGSTEVTIDGTIYPISHLTTHLEITGSPQTNQAKIELVALYNYSSDIKIIKEKLDNFLITKRKIFGINIRDVLYDFVAIGVKTISIDNKNYSIAELLKPDNIDKEYSAMSLGAQTEFTNLLADNINRNKLILIYKDKLDSFLVDIKPTLQIFAKFKVNQFKIDEKIYPIDHLLKDNNLQLIGSAQTGNAKIEFRYLIANNITKSQLDNALVEILKIQEETKNPIQDLKFKPLIIGFSVAAGVLILSSIVGASVYWFLRIKNSQ